MTGSVNLLKLVVTPTQLEKLKRNPHSPQIPIRLFVRRDHRGRGGGEMPAVVTNPFFNPSAAPQARPMEGEGLKKFGKKLKKAANKATPYLEAQARLGSEVAKIAAPVALAAGRPELAAGLTAGAAITDTLLDEQQQQPQYPPYYQQPPPPPQQQQPPPQQGQGRRAPRPAARPRYQLAKKKHP